jgi:hypothetical protein
LKKKKVIELTAQFFKKKSWEKGLLFVIVGGGVFLFCFVLFLVLKGWGFEPIAFYLI